MFPPVRVCFGLELFSIGSDSSDSESAKPPLSGMFVGTFSAPSPESVDCTLSLNVSLSPTIYGSVALGSKSVSNGASSINSNGSGKSSSRVSSSPVDIALRRIYRFLWSHGGNEESSQGFNLS